MFARAGPPAGNPVNVQSRVTVSASRMGALVNSYSVAVSGQPQTGPMTGRARIANLANVLTLLRLVLVPIFLLALFVGDGHQIAGRLVAFVIFAIACITDRFDGLLARNYGMAAEFGAFVDPIADKALIGSALIGLSMLGDLPWWVTVVILAREIGITGVRVVVLGRGGGDPGQSRRQTQNPRAGGRDRIVRAAAVGIVAGGGVCRDGGRDRVDPG